jgi:pyridinium-3,5-biscarboxylic acid mononucleotide sulfurtransferase
MLLSRPPVAGQGPSEPSVIVAQLASARSALVALSGGVDSSVVAALAFQALGAKAVAVTLTGPAVPPDEVRSAREAARAVGIRHVLLTSDPLSDPRYAGNPTNRCYFCRNHEGDLLRAWGEERSIERYLDGVHLDDLGDDRPGLRAMDEHGFQHPLVDAGWAKAEVRSYARSIALPTWDRPSNACLASRVAHGQMISIPLLKRVAEAEAWLSARGFRRVRVRVSGEQVRIEVDPAEVSRLMSGAFSDPLRAAMSELGFASVEVDPRGYRSGLES